MKFNTAVIKVYSKVFEEELFKEFTKYGTFKTVEVDKIILEIRRPIKFIPFIVEGDVKVMRRDGKGNGILLHYLTSGETSSIAVNYAFENKNSEIRLKAESSLSYLAIPVNVVNLWAQKYHSWRAYISKLSQVQTSSLLTRINDIAFEDLEVRLKKYLKETSKVKKSAVLNRSHFDIARDLKVSRESVSRGLKKLETERFLSLGRHRIVLNNGIKG